MRIKDWHELETADRMRAIRLLNRGLMKLALRGEIERGEDTDHAIAALAFLETHEAMLKK